MDDAIDIVPPLQSREGAGQDFPRQSPQPIAHLFQKFPPGRAITLPQSIEQLLQLNRGRGGNSDGQSRAHPSIIPCLGRTR